MGPEMPREPRVQTPGEVNAINVFRMLEGVHDFAELIEQTLVIALVRIQPVVAVIAHAFLLEREMHRDSLEQVSEEGRYRQLRTRAIQFFVKVVNEVDQLLVLMINGLDSDAVLFLPVQ